MGTIKTTNIEPIADNGTVTLGSSGDTFTLGSGVTQTIAINTPAFYSYQSSNQSITSGTTTKINFQTEILDSDNNFASSTFTPTTAGYYLITVGLKCFSGSAEYFLVLRRNGSNYHTLRNEVFTNYQLSGSAIVYANGSGDYFDVTFFQNSGSTRTTTATQLNTWFSGFRIIGV